MLLSVSILLAYENPSTRDALLFSPYPSRSKSCSPRTSHPQYRFLHMPFHDFPQQDTLSFFWITVVCEAAWHDSDPEACLCPGESVSSTQAGPLSPLSMYHFQYLA